MIKLQLPIQTAVDVWAVDLDTKESSHYESLLSVDERERAGRFRFERDRHRYVVGRGCLRRLIAQYLAISPAKIMFAYNDYGKPYLPAQPEQPDLRFNVTHSQQFALLGFTWCRRLGVDIEIIRPFADLDDLVCRFFAPDEVSAWRTIHPAQQIEAFLCGWTRKEAFIKAIGDGLSYPLDQFVVSLHPDEQARLIAIEDSTIAVQNWEVISLRPFPQTIAAIVVENAAPGHLAPTPTTRPSAAGGD
jgi:4'-phosphopantetheinyl transferase